MKPLIGAAILAWATSAGAQTLSITGAERDYQATGAQVKCTVGASGVTLHAETDDFTLDASSQATGSGSYPLRASGVLDKRENPVRFSARAADVSITQYGSSVAGKAAIHAPLRSARDEARFDVDFDVPCAKTGPEASVREAGRFQPTGNAAPGDTVDLLGEKLDGVTGVLFNGAPARFNVASATRVRVVVPANATSGPVTLQTAAGSVEALPVFTVDRPVAIAPPPTNKGSVDRCTLTNTCPTAPAPAPAIVGSITQSDASSISFVVQNAGNAKTVSFMHTGGKQVSASISSSAQTSLGTKIVALLNNPPTGTSPMQMRVNYTRDDGQIASGLFSYTPAAPPPSSAPPVTTSQWNVRFDEVNTRFDKGHCYRDTSTDFPMFAFNGSHQAGAFTGCKGDDSFFVGMELRNGWTVKEVKFGLRWPKQCEGVVNTCGAKLSTGPRAGDTSLKTVVHWWADMGTTATYDFEIIIQGPSNTSPGVPVIHN